METRQVKRSIEALLGHYIGQKIRENDFDPTGKGSSSMLDNLAHYDLAINVALWYLNEKKGADMNELIGAISPSHNNCSNRLEREAIILSSFAGMILNSLPVTDILSLYSCKPSVSCPYPDTKSNIIHPFSLSYHPFAMLSSFKAVDRSRKHTQMLKRWKALRNKRASAEQEKQMVSSPTPSSPSSFSDSVDSLKEQTKHYEGSEESQQD
ncbi:uncharacterized protein C2orf80-like [Silurus meridionalis]|uniref:Uncharacterized protein n=1 Tax=Silurus meridionalis TaxID=175797 RepID=A0A8T0BRL8_SILME|nr:uncharacterized protein C2orf80-like [Silurus meridionalis]XP_046701509.1 uncharacterized protein C2orf80-like [Silurus meridionalis]KAF7709525.1 hypothetical protein HF521_016375 [Silurus meridionalis]